MKQNSAPLTANSETFSISNPTGLIDTAENVPASFSEPTQKDSICLSIVSKSRLLRDGLVALLASHVDINLVNTYGGDISQIPSLPVIPGHVVLIDNGIGRELAIAWTTRWRSLSPPACVVVLELDDNPDTILGCIEAGASGYVLQGAPAKEVAETIELVHQGMARCSPEMTAKMFTRLASLKSKVAGNADGPMTLTPRELEVLSLVARGCSDKEIATELIIQVRTVKHHVHNILGKLDLHRRWEAARYASERGWLDSAFHSANVAEASGRR